MNTNINKNKDLDEKLTSKDLDQYSVISSKNNFLNMKHQMRKLITFKKKIRSYTSFFSPIIFVPFLLGTLSLPQPHAMLIFAGVFFISITLLPLINARIDSAVSKHIQEKESFKKFQADIIEMITHPNNSTHIFNTLSKLANNIENLKDKELYLHNLHEFLNHIIDKKITVSDMEFFLNQDSLIKDLSLQKNEENKINSFLQQLKNETQSLEMGFTNNTVAYIVNKQNNTINNDLNPIAINGKVDSNANSNEDEQDDQIYIKLQQVKDKFSQHI